MFPGLHHDPVPVDVMQDAVLVIVEDVHVVSTPVVVVAHPGTGIVGHELYIGFPVAVAVAPVDREIMRTGINPIPIAVDQQAIIIGITGPVGPAHIIIIIDPDDGDAVIDLRAQDVRISVLVEILPDDVPDDGCHAPGQQLRVPVPVRRLRTGRCCQHANKYEDAEFSCTHDR